MTYIHSTAIYDESQLRKLHEKTLFSKIQSILLFGIKLASHHSERVANAVITLISNAYWIQVKPLIGTWDVLSGKSTEWISAMFLPPFVCPYERKYSLCEFGCCTCCFGPFELCLEHIQPWGRKREQTFGGFVKFHNDANGTKYASIPMHQSKEWLFPVNPVWYFICCWVCCHPSECSLLLREHYEKVACLIFCPLQMPLSTSSSFCVTYETRVK